MTENIRPVVVLVTRVTGAAMGTATRTDAAPVATPVITTPEPGVAIPGEHYIGVVEAARMAGRHPQVIRDWIAQGELPAVKANSTGKRLPWLIRPADLRLVGAKGRRQRRKR